MAYSEVKSIILFRLRWTFAALAVMASTSLRRDPSPAVFAASARRPAPRWPSRKRSAGTSALTVNSWPRTVPVSLACWEPTGRRGSTYLARGAQTKPLRPGTVKFLKSPIQSRLTFHNQHYLNLFIDLNLKWTRGEYDKIPVFWHVMATKSTYISNSSGVLKLPLSKSWEKDLCCVARKHPHNAERWRFKVWFWSKPILCL